jgi:hypothetical protein
MMRSRGELAPSVRVGSTRKDFYVTTADLAHVLGVSANELSQLHRSSVLTRVANPENTKAVLYPVFDSIRRYCEYRRSKRSVAHEKFLDEKAGRERATRIKIEAFNRERAGELVDKRELIARLEPIVAAYREQLLARADRLERQLALVKGREKKAQKIRENDLDSLKVLSDLFRVAAAGENGNV